MFKSKAQRRKFYADPKLHRFINEFEAATPKNKKLPEHVPKKKKKSIKRKSNKK